MNDLIEKRKDKEPDLAGFAIKNSINPGFKLKEYVLKFFFNFWILISLISVLNIKISNFLILIFFFLLFKYNKVSFHFSILYID